MKISNLVNFNIFFADLGERVSTWILKDPPPHVHVVYGCPQVYFFFTVRNVCNFSIQGYIKFPICLLNLLHLVILVYSGILNFLSVY